MMDTRDVAYDLVVEVLGERFLVRRSLELARRIEQSFGPIMPFARRLEQGHATQVEITQLYTLLLEKQHLAPTRHAIAEWVFTEGTMKPALAVAGQVFSLIMGNEAVAAFAEQEETKSRAPAKEPPERARPFGPTAA